MMDSVAVVYIIRLLQNIILITIVQHKMEL